MNWRTLWEWKTGLQGSQYGGDFRVIMGITTKIPVPAGQWFQLETFTHRACDSSGHWWAKINGQVLFDHSGPNEGGCGGIPSVSYCNGPCPINRVFLSQDYTNGVMPAWQYADDIAIWDGIP